MVYVNTVQVLTESEPRMNGSRMYEFSHREGGFSFYDINTGNESTNDEMETVEQSLTRQGIPANIYPDRLSDNVIFIRFTKTGEEDTIRYPYRVLLILPNGQDDWVPDDICYDKSWEGQIKNGNVYSIAQFMRPDDVK